MKMISILVAFCFYAAPLAAHEGGHDTRGVVVSASADELVVKTGHGEEKFAVTDKTQFVKDGSAATAQDLQASDRVVVHAKKEAGRLQAVKVQFKRATAAPHSKKQ